VPRPLSHRWPSDPREAPRRFLARRLASSDDPALHAVHELLVAAATEEAAPARRRLPFVALDGTPFVYSHKTGSGGFRLLAEPGALARDVPSQIDFALETLDGIVGLLGWRAAAGDVNDVVRAALPPTADGARELRGGVALGVAADDELEVRVYLDLRGGTGVERWQRVANALAPFAGAEVEATFRRLVERAAPLAVPVGLAAVLRDAALRGLRLYVGVERAGRAELEALTALPAAMLDPFRDLLGPFRPQRVTVAFDFVLLDGALRAALARTKLDACRLSVPDDAARAQMADLLDAYALDATSARSFLEDLDASFGGATIQYLGLGVRGPTTEVTVYAQPANLARG